MSELRVPPDGVIARHMADREEGMKADQRRYLHDCLLRAMRDEPLPQPMNSYKVKPIEAVAVRQRAQALAPLLERIRAGEEPLPREPVQERLDI